MNIVELIQLIFGQRNLFLREICILKQTVREIGVELVEVGVYYLICGVIRF
tara:strand:+ start:95 stop:247 length:153 start_codon:yes stop_codon:yes gene_type:complete